MKKLTPDSYAWYDNMISKGYAEKNESYFSVYFQGNHSEIFKEILLSAGGENSWLLDIGCGPGKYTEMLTLGYAYVVGLDRSEQSLTYGHKHHRVANLNYSLGDSQNIPFSNETFETVSTRLSPHNLLEMLRVLKPKGLALCMRVGEHDAFNLRGTFEQQGLVNKMRQYIDRAEHHSQHIVEQWNQVGFINVNSSEHEYDMHFRTTADLSNYLSRIPIIPEFDSNNVYHMHKLQKYVEQNINLQTRTIIVKGYKS
jgi:ubiquinone/menaquinone biosynthesis C-methylase UbiE